MEQLYNAVHLIYFKSCTDNTNWSGPFKSWIGQFLMIHLEATNIQEKKSACEQGTVVVWLTLVYVATDILLFLLLALYPST